MLQESNGGKFILTSSSVITDLYHDLTRLSLTLIYTDTLYLTVVQFKQSVYY